ncbi:MAG: hypothetical protein ACMXX5_01885 [Candidatus Woesearchaeota archaeon]
MASKKLIGFLATNISIATIVSSAFFTYRFYQPMRRAVNNVFYNDVNVEQGFFRDPNGLSVESIINEHGTREVYLIHQPSNSKIEIKQDMFPDTASMLETLLRRANEMQPEESRQYLRTMNEIQRAMYERL